VVGAIEPIALLVLTPRLGVLLDDPEPSFGLLRGELVGVGLISGQHADPGAAAARFIGD
jgi:hypothetical protein